MNKTIHTAPKRKTKFNFIDALLILVILAAALLIVYFFTSDGIGNRSSAVTLEYQVLITGVQNEYRDLVQIGDGVIDSVGLFEIGTVSDVKYEDYLYAVENPKDGTVVLSEYPDHSNIILYIRADATIENGFYYINGYKLAVGKLVCVRSPNFTEAGYCTVITEVE